MKNLIFRLIQNKHSRRVIYGALTWCVHYAAHMVPHIGSHLVSHIVISSIGSLFGAHGE